MLYLATTKNYKTQAEAVQAAEAVYKATKGMFACLEGQVWVSYDTDRKTYKVWVIGGSYIPTSDEVYDACAFEGIPFLYVANFSIKAVKELTTTYKVVKWARY